MPIRDVDDLICALLRGDPLSWPSGPPDLTEVFLERSRYHGVDVLLNERLAAIKNPPPAVIETLRLRSIAEASWEMRDSQILSQVLDALARYGVGALLFKGASLAYSTYSNPSTRMRSDADLLIESEARPIAEQCLAIARFCRRFDRSRRFGQLPEVLRSSDGWRRLACGRSALENQ